MRFGWFRALKYGRFGKLTTHLRVRNGITNCFATYFLLSYTKLMHAPVIIAVTLLSAWYTALAINKWQNIMFQFVIQQIRNVLMS